MTAKINKYLAEYEKSNEAMKKKVEAGEITKEQYQKWCRDIFTKVNGYKPMLNALTKDAVNADKIAMSVVGDHLPQVYAINANFATYQIEKETNLNTAWQLYDRQTVEKLMRDDPDLLPVPDVNVPLDKRWNRQHISNAITQGILQGEPIEDIAKRLETVVNMDYNAAIRNARTATTAAQNCGRIASYERAERLGIEMEKEWLATLDGKTRHEHRILDGQRVAIDKKFTVNGDEIAFPGDPEAEGYLIYNCRCTLVPAIKGHDQSTAPRDSKLGDMSYEEWKYLHEMKVNNSSGSDDVESKYALKEFLYNVDELGRITNYKPVMMNASKKTEMECIESVCGWDKTRGSCASMALAYIGQMNGYNVHDMKGGKSRDWFASRMNVNLIMRTIGAEINYVQEGGNEIQNAIAALERMEFGKQYFLSAGEHASIVKRTKDGWKYLDLQKEHGCWDKFTETTFLDRFCCCADDYSSVSYFDIGQIKASDEFRTLLGYINT